VHAEREAVELKDEMFAPREDVAHGLAPKALDADRAVAGHEVDTPAHEWTELLGGQMD